MTRKDMRYADSVIHMAMNVAGAIAFGIYMHSFLLSIGAYVILRALLNIGWAIEYGQDGKDA